MANSTQWIEYKGKKMLLCDFSGCNEATYLERVPDMEQELLKQPKGSVIPLIVDVTKSSMTPATRDRGQTTIDLLIKADIKTITVMVGITGLQKLIAQALSKEVHFVDTVDSAKEWLATQ